MSEIHRPLEDDQHNLSLIDWLAFNIEETRGAIEIDTFNLSYITNPSDNSELQSRQEVEQYYGGVDQIELLIAQNKQELKSLEEAREALQANDPGKVYDLIEGQIDDLNKAININLSKGSPLADKFARSCMQEMNVLRQLLPKERLINRNPVMDS